MIDSDDNVFSVIMGKLTMHLSFDYITEETEESSDIYERIHCIDKKEVYGKYSRANKVLSKVTKFIQCSALVMLIMKKSMGYCFT